MKNTIYTKIFLLLLVSLSMACGDLEEEVFSFYAKENFLTTEDELRSQALGLYDFNPRSSLEAELFTIVTMPSKYYASKNLKVSGAGIVYAEGSSGNSYEVTWKHWYKLIARANAIIEYADIALVSVPQEVINQYKAEAYFFRAYCYFNLVRTWGAVPLHTKPIESNDFELLNKGNSDVETIYNQIVTDLTFAKQNLPKLEWNNSPDGRIRAATAIQLQGLVYLTMAGKPLEQTANYQLAIDALEELTENEGDYSVGLLSNWMDNFDNANKVNSEKLFSIGSIGISGWGSGLPRRIAPPSQVGYANAGAYQYAVSHDLYLLYEDQDVRKKDGYLFTYQPAKGKAITYKPGNDNAPKKYGGRNGISHLKYTDGTATSPTTHINESFYMRYVESFLILAEAYNELGNSSKAQENLNIVRSRVNATDIDENDQTLLRQIIREERSRELFHEYTELYDMRRWGTSQENFDNHPLRLKWYASLVWNDRFELSPMPLSELSRNANLDQNPGW